jgi:hypothetical protein
MSYLCQEPHYRVRFSPDPSGLVLGTGESLTIFEALDGANSPLLKLELKRPEQGCESFRYAHKSTISVYQARQN